MITGYAVEVFDGFHYTNAKTWSIQYNNVDETRRLAAKHARIYGGVVRPCGILTDEDIEYELQMMEKDG